MLTVKVTIVIFVVVYLQLPPILSENLLPYISAFGFAIRGNHPVIVNPISSNYIFNFGSNLVECIRGECLGISGFYA